MISPGCLKKKKNRLIMNKHRIINDKIQSSRKDLAKTTEIKEKL